MGRRSFRSRRVQPGGGEHFPGRDPAEAAGPRLTRRARRTAPFACAVETAGSVASRPGSGGLRVFRIVRRFATILHGGEARLARRALSPTRTWRLRDGFGAVGSSADGTSGGDPGSAGGGPEYAGKRTDTRGWVAIGAVRRPGRPTFFQRSGAGP